MSKVFVSTVCSFVLVFSFCFTIYAQNPHSSPIPPTDKRISKGKAKLSSEKEPKKPLSQEELDIKAKTDFALSLINSLADEAKKYDDRVVSVRVQARAADLLWKVDAERARDIFFRAWLLAETVEAEEQKVLEEKKRKYLSGESKNGFIPLPPNLRGEILRLVARHDKQFSEELLARFKKKNEENADSEKDDNFDPTEPDLATARRLELALYLLENGEIEKALAIADVSLNRATTQGIIFLIALRNKLPNAADLRYSNLLRKSAVDSQSDATSVSLLSSYVFTPTVIVTTTQNGTASRTLDANPNAPAIPENLKLDFLKTAAKILSRPLPPLQQDRTSAGREGLHFTITRLLPLFQQYLPESVPLLQGQLGIIAQSISQLTQERTDYFAKAGFGSDNKKEQELSDILQEIDSSENKDQNDNLYAQAARLAAAQNDLKARDFAEKISNDELKNRVLAFVDFTLIKKAIEQKDTNRALNLLNKAKLPRLQRIWFMTEIANLFDEKSLFEARQLLDEAEREAQKAGIEDSWKANTLSAVAVSYLPLDPSRGWQIASEAVRAANKSNFFGDKSDLSVTLQTGRGVSMLKVNAKSLNIAELFIKLASDDIYWAADLAGSLSDNYQRALSLLAVAGSQIKK